ncbi:MAG: hypothetical protein HFE63_11180 [Clostridiales bacterium]|nr:hypothetical protein [Clostridiales bacterium]
MKKKYAVLSVILGLLLVMSSIAVYAYENTNTEHKLPHSHIEHEGSEACIYSCPHDFNTYTECSGRKILSIEAVKKFLKEYKKSPSDEELILLLAKLYNMPVEEVSLEKFGFHSKD